MHDSEIYYWGKTKRYFWSISLGQNISFLSNENLLWLGSILETEEAQRNLKFKTRIDVEAKREQLDIIILKGCAFWFKYLVSPSNYSLSMQSGWKCLESSFLKCQNENLVWAKTLATENSTKWKNGQSSAAFLMQLNSSKGMLAAECLRDFFIAWCISHMGH